jgi:hypothetical protein
MARGNRCFFWRGIGGFLTCTGIDYSKLTYFTGKCKLNL